MLLARMIAPIQSLGPGKRLGLWFQGCSKNCYGCMSPELQIYDSTKNVPIKVLLPIIESEMVRNECTGLTISGGDPFEQPEELYELLKALRPIFNDILVYTGFSYQEIKESKIMSMSLEFIDVLIDGRYIEKQNTGKSRLYGSDNQNIYYLNSKVKRKYEIYNKEEHQLETFMHNNKVITIGIQKRG